ncbi:MAG: MBL fold metallo-hydrolase [Chloroflexota bacterium]
MNDAFERVHENVYRLAVPLQGVETHSYLLIGRQVALVDTCTADSVPAFIEPALRSLGLGLGDVDVVVNTHPHWDHAGGNAGILRAGAAQVMLHEDDRPFTLGPEACLGSEFDVASAYRALGRPDLVATRRNLLAHNLGSRMQVDRWLADGDEIDLGRGVVLQVVHTPGHTAGSISLYWQREEMLFTGDSIQGRGSHAGSLPFYFHAARYRSSHSRLLALPLAALCLGHGFCGATSHNPPVRRGPAVAALLADSLAVTGLIDAAVEQTLSGGVPEGDAGEFARSVLARLQYDLPVLLNRDTGVDPSAVATIQAHLRARR